jgi:hypothetical protein
MLHMLSWALLPLLLSLCFSTLLSFLVAVLMLTLRCPWLACHASFSISASAQPLWVQAENDQTELLLYDYFVMGLTPPAMGLFAVVELLLAVVVVIWLLLVVVVM